jgi:hypothetical protein
LRRLAALSALLAALLAGCGVDTSSERTYDDALIKQIGSGSTALVDSERTLEAARFGPGLRDPKLQPSLTALFEGKLSKLTQDDLVAIAEANRKIAGHYGAALRKLDSAQSRLKDAVVPATGYEDLSGGAKRFVSGWNGYLAGLAGALGLELSTLENEEPRVNELQTVLRDAYRSRDRASAARFDAARLRYLHEVVSTGRRIQATKARIAKAFDSRALRDLAKHDAESEAIVKQVNERYPQGALAKEFT